MKRNLGYVCARLMFIALVLLICIGVAGQSVATAGDEDGVNGYSMRLKHKDFSADDGAGSSGLVIIAGDPQKPLGAEPVLTAGHTSVVARFSLALFDRYRAWYRVLIR